MAQNTRLEDTVETIRARVDQIVALVQTNVSARLDDLAAGLADVQLRLAELQAARAVDEEPPDEEPAEEA